MLKFVSISHPDLIYNFFNQSEFNLKDSNKLYPQTWIVSDLKSKNEIQKLLIDQQGYYLESSILRASDFWKIALRRLAPFIQPVSSEFIKILVDSFVEKFGTQLEIKSSESSTLAAYVHELAPILLHPESDSILSEWFDKQSVIKKWHRWHLLSRACMTYILNEYQVIDTKWIAAYLQKVDIGQFNWSSDLFVDLGTEMSSVEMGLFKTLSKKTNVKIIWPKPSFENRYSFLLKTYKDNLGYAESTHLDLPATDLTKANQFVRVSTQLAEVKYAIAKIREWYDQGISIQNIAIISSQIEKYWPALKFFLDEEGLIYKKDHVVRLSSLGFIQYFLAYCTNLSSDVSWDSLETSLFAQKNKSLFNFDQFKALFYQLYDESDLNRDSKIKDLFYKKIDTSKKISREQFLSLITRYWLEANMQFGLSQQEQHEHHNELFETIFKDFISRSTDVQTYFNRWFQFLKTCVHSKEIKIKLGDPEGIHILPLMSAHLSSSSHQIWLGLDEKSLASNKKSLIPSSDVFELKNQFDFAIDYPEESFYDFNIRWLLNKNANQKIFICSNSSFDAEPLTPSLFFLENNSSHDISSVPKTRHDEIQTAFNLHDFNRAKSLPNILDLETPGLNVLGLSKDLNDELNIVKMLPISTLTPSELEEYWKCPFKVLAQKIFKLRDLPQVAVDLDPRQKGSLLHLLFEHLVQNQNDQSMDQFLDSKRIELKVFPQDELLWTIQKNKLMQIGKQFLAFENKRKLEFNGLNNKATEVSFELKYDLEKKEFITDSDLNHKVVTFKGRIDRVDQSQNKIVVYDYKSSTSDLKNYSDWLKQGEFQLLIYLLACEKVLYPGQSVMASVYYDYRKFDYSKGFMTEDFHNRFLQTLRKKKSLADEEQKNAVISDFSQMLNELMTKLNSFDFTAKPEDSKLCSTCNWSKLCRAKHLM